MSGRRRLSPQTRQQGDGRTPEGEYRTDYRKPDSSFHKALHISYPGPTDTAAAKKRSESILAEWSWCTE